MQHITTLRAIFLTCLLLTPAITLAEEPAPAVAATTPTKDWFVSQLKGGDSPFPAPHILGAKDTDAAKAALWADYKSAAIALGWDKEIAPATVCPPFPPLEKLKSLPPEERPKMPAFTAANMPCGGENMPYLLFSRGERPAKGFPLFFQTHGGGGTDQKLENPHAWDVNTRDWKNQVGVCLFALPEGLYFVPRMANDNKGRWWMKHNHIAFDTLIRRAILFRDADPDRIYMMGISEGAYGTEALTPFWPDRFAGACAMSGGAGGGERLYNLRNVAYRNDSGEKDTMFDRIKLAQQAHDYLDALKKADPAGYDHSLAIQPGRGHGIDYTPGPAWVSTKIRNTRPDKVNWLNYALDAQRRTDFYWLSLATAPERDAYITAAIQRDANRIVVTAHINPPEGERKDAPVYDAATSPPATGRIPYTGNTLTLHLDDRLIDLDKPVTVILNDKQVFSGPVQRDLANMAADIARHGDPGRVFPARLEIKL